MTITIERVRNVSHLIFADVHGKLGYYETVPYVYGDGNHGLPDYFFEGYSFVNFVLDSEGFVEWIPACGPAPCWKARYADFDNHEDMIATWLIWIRETY